ncbi:tRNA1(Val) (adenine(37)-N6)-methyltransferase [Shewanella sp. NFH-SH190041]|uniref:tRNA1(Val) (adenine(37)-N6)-methyltransferase n=1 Tax=Shewanella sp. NFH-SH190041 TaxID=2950245 RepID=UPI0021C47DBA|nr:methyltransferase [Shewanella sp. NFH-SH190041]BDM63524.1 tRNA1(Val) (adenine(37)-N6)-methyltransferase [Shewanella sp. NFH-SH190041]
MAFTFKQFHIEDFGCGMPVSTDGVILGAWAPLTDAGTILDIGAGSGLLSLMAAQRSQAHISAIEIDDTAAKACQANFAASPWAARLQLHHQAIQQFVLPHNALADHIICNPPYFETGPKSVKTGRAMARHTDTLGFTELLEAISRLLSNKGQASLILPTQSLSAFRSALTTQPNLHLIRRCELISVQGKAANRVLLLLGRQPIPECQTEQLVIRERNNQYSEQMISLTRDFYLNL